MDAARRRPGRVRAPVPVQAMLSGLQQVSAVGTNIFALMRRIVLVILQRIARLFNVDVDHKGLADDNGRPEAAFTGDPDFPDNVTEAAAAATQQLSSFVEEALTGGREGAVAKLTELSANGAATAYLAMTLDQFTGAMFATEAQIRGQEEPLARSLGEVAARLKVEPQALQDLIAGGSGSLTLPDDPQLSELSAGYAQMAEAKQQLVRLKVAFCDYCVAARELDEGGPIDSVAKQKAQLLGDADLLKAIEMAHAHGYNGKENALKNTVVANEILLRSDISPAPSQELKSAPAQSSPAVRTGFRNKSYFVTEEEGRENPDPDFDDRSAEQSRMRQR
jgi:hypothetical protein